LTSTNNPKALLSIFGAFPATPVPATIVNIFEELLNDFDKTSCLLSVEKYKVLLISIKIPCEFESLYAIVAEVLVSFDNHRLIVKGEFAELV